MGMLEQSVSGKIINNRHASVGGLELSVGRFSPDFGAFRAALSVLQSIGHLVKIGRPR